MRRFALLAALALAATLAHAAASPNYATVSAPSSAVITDAAGNTWGLTPAPCTATWAAAGTTGMVTLNGAADATSCSVIEIAYVNGVIWQENASKAWYSKTSATAGWVAGVNPLPAAPTYLASATLTWAAPAVDNQGNPLTVPLSYNVYRGAAATNLTKLTNTTALTYVDPAGSSTPTLYYYAITATCTSCVESAQSNVVSDTIAAPALATAAPVLTVH